MLKLKLQTLKAYLKRPVDIVDAVLLVVAELMAAAGFALIGWAEIETAGFVPNGPLILNLAVIGTALFMAALYQANQVIEYGVTSIMWKEYE